MSNIIKSHHVKKGKKIKKVNQTINRLTEKKSCIEENSNQEVEKKVSGIISDAKKEAKNIVDKAFKEAEKIKTEAKEKVQEDIKDVLEESREEGYTKGIKLGREDGYKEGINHFQELLRSLEEEIKSFNQSLKDREDQLAKELIKLAVAISEKIINRELQLDRELISKIVKDSINLLDDKEEVKIRINSSDFDVIDKCKKELISSSNGVERVKVVTDRNVKYGCIIETNFGGFDVTIGSQLEEIEAKLLEVNYDE